MKIDKKLHLFAGWILASLFGTHLLIGLIFASVIGIGKEIVYDKWMKKGTPDILDALATIVGGVLYCVFKYFYIKFFI